MNCTRLPVLPFLRRAMLVSKAGTRTRLFPLNAGVSSFSHPMDHVGGSAGLLETVPTAREDFSPVRSNSSEQPQHACCSRLSVAMPNYAYVALDARGHETRGALM